MDHLVEYVRLAFGPIATAWVVLCQTIVLLLLGGTAIALITWLGEKIWGFYHGLKVKKAMIAKGSVVEWKDIAGTPDRGVLLWKSSASFSPSCSLWWLDSDVQGASEDELDELVGRWSCDDRWLLVVNRPPWILNRLLLTWQLPTAKVLHWRFVGIAD